MPKTNRALEQLLRERSIEVNQYINIISKSWFKESFHGQITSHLFDIIQKSCDYFNEYQGSNFSKKNINSFHLNIRKKFTEEILSYIDNNNLRYSHFHEERPVTNDSERKAVLIKVAENTHIVMEIINMGGYYNEGDNYYRQQNQEILNHLNENNDNLFDYLVDENESLKNINESRSLASQDEKTLAPAKKAAATIDSTSQENKAESKDNISKKRGAEAVGENKNPIVKKAKLNEEESNSEGKETPSITPNTNSTENPATPIQKKKNSQIG